MVAKGSNRDFVYAPTIVVDIFRGFKHNYYRVLNTDRSVSGVRRFRKFVNRVLIIGFFFRYFRVTNRRIGLRSKSKWRIKRRIIRFGFNSYDRINTNRLYCPAKFFVFINIRFALRQNRPLRSFERPPDGPFRITNEPRRSHGECARRLRKETAGE